MKKISFNEIIKAVNGKGYNEKDIYIDNISTDSREENNGLFIPLIGDNFDGHNFIEDAINKGASAFISDREIYTNTPYILVKDTKYALMDLAKYYRSLFDIKVIAITGSAGKTTTKDMVASILSKKYNVLKNEGNLNNEIGLPLTIFNLKEDTQIAVLEMGMNNFGEIDNLSNIVEPDFGLITNIGIAHIGRLGSKDGIFKAKTELLNHMQEDSSLILNGDDEYLKKLKDSKFNKYYYSLKDKDVYLYMDKLEYMGIDETRCKFRSGENEIDIKIPVPGEHMIYNTMAAVTIGLIFDIPKNDIEDAILNFKLSKNRMDILEINNMKIINDVYNSNPDSVKEMLNLIKLADGRKVVILGDMLELGEDEIKLHEEIGEIINKTNIDLGIYIGKLSKNIYNGHGDSDKSFYFETKEDFYRQMPNILNEGDTVLVKASRGMKFEEIIDKISNTRGEL